jgi:hypothetical protein
MVSTWVIIGVGMLFVAYAMVHFLHDWREGTRHVARGVERDDASSDPDGTPVTDPFGERPVRRNFHHGSG